MVKLVELVESSRSNRDTFFPHDTALSTTICCFGVYFLRFHFNLVTDRFIYKDE